MSDTEPSRKPKPEPPPEGCCCKGGCFPCVWDYYRWALEDWEKENAQSLEEPGVH